MSDKPREKILAAADRIFGEVGYDAATTRQIAEGSGCNKALIHYHFRSKAGLLQALLDRYYQALGEQLTGAFEAEGSLRERMHRLADGYLDFLRDNLNFGKIVQREASGGAHMEQIQEQMGPLFALGTRVVEEFYPSTRAGALAASQVLISCYGMIISYFAYSGVVAHLLGDDPMSDGRFAARKQHVRRMLDIVLDAVEAQEAAP